MAQVGPPARHFPGRTQMQKHPVLMFYLLAFAISWLGYVPVLAGDRGLAAFKSPAWAACLLLPALGPALAAWIVTAQENPVVARPGLRENLLRRVSWLWGATALLLPLSLVFLSDRLGQWLQPGHLPVYPPVSPKDILPTALIAILANPWEEVGWRGFALVRLQDRYHPAFAAAIVGMLWALWHIPLFLWHGSSMYGFPFGTWAVGTIGKSFLYAWLFNRSGRSLAVVMAFHISINVFGALFGIRSFRAESFVDLAAAVVILAVCGPRLAYQRGPRRA